LEEADEVTWGHDVVHDGVPRRPSPLPALPDRAMMTSDELDWLVYSYLEESGYHHTSFSPTRSDPARVVGALVRVLALALTIELALASGANV
jgi:hypothetical protein